MTLKEAYEYGQEQLKNAEIDDAVLDAWYLLEHVTGISRSMYFMDMNREISSEQETMYRTYILICARADRLQCRSSHSA